MNFNVVNMLRAFCNFSYNFFVEAVPLLDVENIDNIMVQTKFLIVSLGFRRILKKFLQAIVCAGLYPNVAATEQGIAAVALNGLKQSSSPAIKAHPVWYDGRREVHIHPSSINSNLKAFQYPFLVFLEKVCKL